MEEIKDMEITYTEEQKNPKNTKLQGSMEWSGCLENVKVSNVLKSIKESEFIIEFTGKLKQPIPDVFKQKVGLFNLYLAQRVRDLAYENLKENTLELNVLMKVNKKFEEIFEEELN